MPDDDPYSTPRGQLDQYDTGFAGRPDSYDEGYNPETDRQPSGTGQDQSSQSGQGTTGSGQATAKDKGDKDGLPAFDPKKTYLVKGDTLNRFASLIKRNKPKAVTGGGVRVAQESQDGTFFAIDADELKLAVCISGVSTTKTFYVKKTSGS